MSFNIKKIYNQEVKIALAMIAALCILIYGINYLKGVNIFKPATYYYVKFSDVNGLTKSSPVFAGGFKVGMVRDIDYDYIHPGHIAVEIKLDTKMRIPKGSTAQIASNLMGGLRLNLLLATNTNEFMQVGDTISGGLDAGLMASFSQLLPQVEKMLPKIDSILTSLNALVNDPSIRASLHSLQGTTANLNAASMDLKLLMRNNVPRLIGKLDRVSDNFITISGNLKSINFNASMSKIDSTLVNIKLMTDQLNSKDNSVGLLLHDKQLYYNMSNTFMNASNLMEDLKANPKRYVHFSIFGRKK